MRRTASGLVTLGAALAAIGGCDGGVSFDQLPAETAEAVCQISADCLGDFAQPGCREDVEADQRAATQPRFQVLIDRGTLTYDAAAARRCIDESVALGCSFAIQAVPAPCRDIFVGSVELGGACSLDEECVGEAFCEDAACPGSPGTCTALLGSGSACFEDRECQTGLVCEDGSCRPPTGRSGGSCGGSTGLTCPLDELCLGSTASAAGVCTPLAEVRSGAEGDPCNLSDVDLALCRPGLSCVALGLNGTSLRTECRARVSTNGACFLGFPNQCPSDQVCNANPNTGRFEGACVALPGVGQPCAQAPGSPQCAAGLSCVASGEAITCVRVQPNGQPCAADGECHSGICEGGTCVAPALCGG